MGYQFTSFLLCGYLEDQYSNTLSVLDKLRVMLNMVNDTTNTIRLLTHWYEDLEPVWEVHTQYWVIQGLLAKF